jgi:hypothetical protein
MKRNIPLLLFLCILFQLNAQSQTANITGVVFDDATKENIELASIRILNAKDSTYVTGGVTASDGKFNVGVKQGNYIAHISFLGYVDQYFTVNTRNKTALGNIYLKEDGITLREAVVTAQAIEVKVMGDTVEYNADSYKVQESAVVEDLVKKLPGAEVDSDGKITVNGKEIKKILVDGKEFFSSDPKVASKNLPAQMVDKLQVLDRKSDMALMTGFDDGDEETVINLTIKKGMKEGLYGSGTAGAGSEDRYGLSGIVNYMRNESQFTLLGGINNTNNEGFTDNVGNSFRGTRGGGGMNFGGRYGLSKSTSGGFNFALNPSDKLKWGGNVRYGETNNDVQQSTFTQTYITDAITGLRKDQYEDRWNMGVNKSDNFSGDFRFEWSPDAVTKIIFSPNFQYGKNTNIQKSNYFTSLVNPTDTVNWGNSETYSEGTSKNLSGRLDISRELGKKGRVLSFSLSGGYNDLESDGANWSQTKYKVASGDSIGLRDQIYNLKNDGYNWRAYASYVEPIGNNNFLQLTYSYRKSHTENDRNTFKNDGLGNYTEVDASATKKLENDFTNQEIRANFKAVREKYDYTIGLALQPSKMESVTSTPKETKPTSNNVFNYAPIAQFNYRWSRQKNLRINYDGSTSQPSATQLSDIRDESDPLNITTGNPNLKPSFSNRFRVRFQNFNPQQGSMMGLFGNLNFTLNDIVTKTIVSENGAKENTYDNINGNWNAFLRMMINKPLSNRKFSINSGTGGSYQQSNGYTNGAKNAASTFNISENLGIRYRSDFGAYSNQKMANNIDLSLRGNFGYNNTVNSLESLKEMNLNTFDYGGSFETTLQLYFGLTFSTDIRYTTNSGYANGYKLNEWLWNASISQQLFKAKNGTLKFSVNDILKQREKIVSQPNVSSRSYVQSTYNTLPSYFMVSFSYRFQSFKGGAKQSDMDGGEGGGWRRGPGGPGGRGPGGPMM